MKKQKLTRLTPFHKCKEALQWMLANCNVCEKQETCDHAKKMAYSFNCGDIPSKTYNFIGYKSKTDKVVILKDICSVKDLKPEQIKTNGKIKQAKLKLW